ncbi:TIGR01244 family sulfur transferase [Neisseria sp.]|uniref:TIGR01244 family sulfur transferase n=1 Tax=Neisseria sp. TaxID=192066 RepID=UPI00359F7DE2
MSILKLTDTLYISPQLTEADAETAARLGIKSVICNRPDAEQPDQPDFARVSQWLAAQNITQAAHQPVTAPAINAADVAEFQRLLSELPAPVLAYCRTGTRSSLLWGFHQVQNGMTTAEVKTAAAKAGVDLTQFEERLNQAAANGLA